MELLEEDKKQIESFGTEEIDPEQIFVFSLVLCDNEIDRDYECFSTNSLYGLANLFVGKSGIFDHDPKVNKQTARIFKTWVEKEDNKLTAYGETYHALKAKAYMVKHADNEKLISEIKTGIKKEVSVGCKMGKKICSKCGMDVNLSSCGHLKGEEVYHILSEPLDAYEWSFVVVPAQIAAGVTKKYGSSENQIDYKSIRISQWNDLKKEAEFGKKYREELMKSFILSCSEIFDQVDGSVVRSIAEKLSVLELIEMKKNIDLKTPDSILFGCDETENIEKENVYRLF